MFLSEINALEMSYCNVMCCKTLLLGTAWVYFIQVCTVQTTRALFIDDRFSGSVHGAGHNQYTLAMLFFLCLHVLLYRAAAFCSCRSTMPSMTVVIILTWTSYQPQQMHNIENIDHKYYKYLFMNMGYSGCIAHEDHSQSRSER
jgi:hypothetical protein